MIHRVQHDKIGFAPNGARYKIQSPIPLFLEKIRRKVIVVTHYEYFKWSIVCELF